MQIVANQIPSVIHRCLAERTAHDNCCVHEQRLRLGSAAGIRVTAGGISAEGPAFTLLHEGDSHISAALKHSDSPTPCCAESVTGGHTSQC